MLFPSLKEKLTLNASDKIDAKITKIKECWNWSLFDVGVGIDGIDLSKLNCDTVSEEKNIFENIAKLSINLINDFDYYQQFLFKSQFDNVMYRELLENIGCEFTDGMYRCVRRPDTVVVNSNVFVYCLYRLIFDKMMEMADNNDCDKCKECNIEVKRVNLVKCGDIYEESQNDFNEINETTSVSGDTYTVDSDIHVHNAMIGQLGVNESLYNWKCAMCDALNEHSHLVCNSCEEHCKSGTWVCTICNAEIGSASFDCEGCQCKNANLNISDQNDSFNNMENIVPIIDNDVPNLDNAFVISDPVEVHCSGWTCKKCKTMQSYNVATCPKCSDSMTVCGSWTCHRCTLVNKCSFVMCDACNLTNDGLLSKYCKSCAKNKITVDREHCDSCLGSIGTNKDKTNKWRCLFSYCRTWNDVKDEFCEKCKLTRLGSHVRGDLIKQWTENGEKHVWICDRCHRANDTNESVCSAYNCNETRYKIKYCYKCVKYNDGKTVNCDKCQGRL